MTYDHNHLLVGIYALAGRSLGRRVDSVAGGLQVSVRTVHRVLANAGLGFVQVRAIAAAEAMAILRAQQPRLGPDDLARQLGFPTARALEAFLSRNARHLAAPPPAGALAQLAGSVTSRPVASHLRNLWQTDVSPPWPPHVDFAAGTHGPRRAWRLGEV